MKSLSRSIYLLIYSYFSLKFGRKHKKGEKEKEETSCRKNVFICVKVCHVVGTRCRISKENIFFVQIAAGVSQSLKVAVLGSAPLDSFVRSH